MSASNRSSAALVVSILALVVAVSGVGYAASKLNGKSIKPRSIPGNRIKNDALTGKQIKEARLGQVPSAATALSAGRATSADRASLADRAVIADRAGLAERAESANRIGSLTETDIQRAGKLITFDVRMTNTEPPRTLLQAGPFTVKAECAIPGGVQNVYRVSATTSENDAAARRTNIFDEEASDADFDVGETFKITESQEGGTPPPPTGPFEMSAYLWSRSGTMVRLELAQGGKLFSANPSERVQCTYAGFAIVS
ncbi:MAG TPA: hypothetical protein VEQ41_10185 [Solirubrobacterales bacterium]|nr:hypothetical protein [Solirubrobacterales bacterium]